MSSAKLLRFTVLATALAGSGAALAQPQTHHCKLADGTMDMKKTHKECTAAKGTWAKDAPKDAPKAGATPAPTAPAPTAPKAGATPAPAPAPTAPAPKK